MSNYENSPSQVISRDLAAIVFGENYDLPQTRISVKIDPQKYPPLVGTYEIGPGNVVVVSLSEDRLYIAPPGQPELEIFPESETEFYVKAFEARLTFIKNEQGEVIRLILHVGGNEMSAKKNK
jgi:hypothetical protein